MVRDAVMVCYLPRMRFLLVVVALAVMSCADGDYGATARSSLEAPRPPDGVGKKLAAQKQPVGPVPQPVDWEAARRTPALQLALPERERPKLGEIEVPVLLPDDPKLLSSLLITHHHDWYAAAMEDNGVDVYVRGNRKAFVVPALQGIEVPDYSVTRVHEILTVSWRAYGVAYTLDVECFAPLEDPRCTNDDYALSLAKSLKLAGGRP